MDDGSRGDFDISRKQAIDHKLRKGGGHEPKPEATEEQRRLRSERMKKFDRKTGKGTALGNARARMKRNPK